MFFNSNATLLSQWTFAMHVIMILGGYFPSFGLWMASPVEDYQDKVSAYKMNAAADSTRRKGGGIDVVSDGAEFPLTSADVWAFEEVSQ